MRIPDPAQLRDARPLDGWAVDPTGRLLTVWLEHPCGTVRVFTAEQPDAVHVLSVDNGFVNWPYDGWAAMGGGEAVFTARLGEPLGNRPVINAATGKRCRCGRPPTQL